MQPTDLVDQEAVWAFIQEPARPSHIPSEMMLLLSALDTGWTLVEPVLYCKTSDYRSGSVYKCLLYNTQTGTLRQISIPQKPETEKYFLEEGYQVSHHCC